jgi:outer membrane biosynthesis protein TonB
MTRMLCPERGPRTLADLVHCSWPPSVVVVCAAALLAAGSGCARAHAKTVPQVADAPLEVPAPPPHEVETTEVEEPPPPPPAPAPEPPKAAPPRPRPAPAPPKPEPKPEPPPEAPKPEEPPRPGSGTLQTTPATVEGELERGVRATLQRATDELNKVNLRGLNADAKVQYDTARRFIRQADDAVKAKNLVFAKNLADKAVVIADQLGGR